MTNAIANLEKTVYTRSYLMVVTLPKDGGLKTKTESHLLDLSNEQITPALSLKVN